MPAVDTATLTRPEADATVWPAWFERRRFPLSCAAVVGWFTWAYLFLRPTGSVLQAHDGIGDTYGPWAWNRLAYSDVIALYGGRHLATHALPYVHLAIEYPVVTGVYMWTAAFAPLGVEGYFLVSSIGLCLCALGTLWLLRMLAPNRYHWFALSPLLLVFGLLNWDLLAILPMIGALVLVRDRRFGWAGVALAIAVFAKFFPLALVFFLLVWMRKDRPAMKSFLKGFVATALVINVPFAVTNPGHWWSFFSFNTSRGGDSGVLVRLHIQHLPTAVNDSITLLVVVLVVAVLVVQMERGLRPEQAAAVAFGVFLLFNKVYSPQYTLWLLPLALVAEWPLWTTWLLGVMGVSDYANSMAILRLTHPHAVPIWGWYWVHIVQPLYDFRYLTIAACLAGAVATTVVRKQRSLVLAPDPPARRATTHAT